jgi:flagellar biosynthesis/type III secretory pathway protein FliH
MTARDIRPFLPLASAPTRALGAVLPALETPATTSPWLPGSAEGTAAAASAPAPAPADVAAIYEDARARGHADGLAETAALRARLTDLLAELAATRAAIAAPAAELIAEIAACVVETWTENAERSALFAPLVRGWIAQAPAQPATARVHPDGAGALAAAIGDAPLAILPDPELAPGALEIRGATLELAHDWRRRIADLRVAIAAALAGGEP